MEKPTPPSSPGEAELTEVETELLHVLESLPPSVQAEVLDFARFLSQRAASPSLGPTEERAGIELCAAPADTLFDLTALVSLGGDAVADTEDLYGGNGDR